MAVEHVNDQGGLFSDGQKYIAVKVDSARDPVAAVDAVTKLVNVEVVTGDGGPFVLVPLLHKQNLYLYQLE